MTIEQTNLDYLDWCGRTRDVFPELSLGIGAYVCHRLAHRPSTAERIDLRAWCASYGHADTYDRLRERMVAV